MEGISLSLFELGLPTGYVTGHKTSNCYKLLYYEILGVKNIVTTIEREIVLNQSIKACPVAGEKPIGA